MSKTVIFIEKARAVHGERYDYSSAAYVSSRKKLSITCLTHGDFEQSPNSHLSGRNCPKCTLRHNYSSAEWIGHAQAVHGERYDYAKTHYTKAVNKVIITCREHGDFKQLPNNHIGGSGCAKCAKQHSHTAAEWVALAVRAHGDRFDYSKVDYVHSQEKVIAKLKRGTIKHKQN